MWTFCHFGYQVGALFTRSLYGHKEWRSAYSSSVLDGKNTRFIVAAVHMCALQEIHLNLRGQRLEQSIAFTGNQPLLPFCEDAGGIAEIGMGFRTVVGFKGFNLSALWTYLGEFYLAAYLHYRSTMVYLHHIRDTSASSILGWCSHPRLSLRIHSQGELIQLYSIPLLNHCIKTIDIQGVNYTCFRLYYGRFLTLIGVKSAASAVEVIKWTCPGVCESVCQLVLNCLVMKFGTGIDLDNISDEFEGQGQRSRSRSYKM